MNAMLAHNLDHAAPASNVTRFLFEHKVFSVPGAVFRLNRASGRVTMCMPLGDSQVSLDLSQLVHAFGLPEDGADSRLFSVVEKALRYVRDVRPGDSIPNEILDGSASWTLAPRHLELARSRLLMQLVTWVTEGHSSIDSSADVLSLIERQDIKEKVNRAFGKAAAHLSLGKDGKQQLTNMIEQLAGELAYIEALREKIRQYCAIRSKLRQLQKSYRQDRTISESIERILRLSTPPLDKISSQFTMIDGNTAEVISSLKQLSATISYVREARDSMREFVLLWDDLDKAWAAIAPEQSPAAEHLIARTYRFIATNYLTSQRWIPQTA